MTKRIHKPVDLIVSNIMHMCVSDLQTLGPLVNKLLGDKADKLVNDEIARFLLKSIALQADISKVFAALEAVGAPCSNDDIVEGRRAVLERAR